MTLMTNKTPIKFDNVRLGARKHRGLKTTSQRPWWKSESPEGSDQHQSHDVMRCSWVWSFFETIHLALIYILYTVIWNTQD